MPTSPPPHTILHQSSPGRNTSLMHDYRLPSGLDAVRRTQQHRSTATSKRPGLMQKQSSSYSVASSVSSDHHSNTAVYVKDAVYVWLPAQIQSSTDEKAVVKIVLPDDWAQTTVLSENSSITELEIQTTSSGFGSYASPKSGESGNLKGNLRKRKYYSYERDPSDMDGSIPKGTQRTLLLMDYNNSEFPLQNTDRHAHRLLSTKKRVQRNTIYHPLVNARDMADLHFLHEAAILYNLKQRHGQNLPYTRVGDIVVAVNPFEWIDGLYSSEKQAIYAKHLIWDAVDYKQDEGDDDGLIAFRQEDVSDLGNISEIANDENDSFGVLGAMPPLTPSGKMIKFRKVNSDAKSNDAPQSERHEPMSHGSLYSKLGLEPHVYETASLAYRGLASDRENQTILVSGESGAGKTETVKIVMSNLATVEQTRPFYHKPGKGNFNHGEQMNSVVKQVLESNPVFEAFGCAKTVRNDNSSRFGRFTQLQYEVESRREAEFHSRSLLPHCLLRGSYCATYLLEKSRVVGHTEGERTYHIFYQLVSAPENEKALIWDGLAGTDVSSFAYIGRTSTNAIEGKSDSESWQNTMKALKSFGFSGQSVRQLLRALCVILQLGNLTFAASQSSEEGSTIASPAELTKLSKLIGISENDLAKAMTTRINHIRGEEVVSRPNPKEAKEGCDALAKSVYACIFDRLVQQINDHTSVSSEQHSSKGSIGTISLLDIFGFERFDVNRFEQLCINFSNERLQHRYVLDNFRAVKEEYTAEGIDIFDFSMVDNSGVLELMESKLGLITALNEECVRPQGKASSFVYKMKMLHNDSKYLLVDKLQGECEFGIKHFAGAVTYDASEFLKSNADLTPKDLVLCASRSSNSLIREEFESILSNLDGAARGPPRRASSKTVIAKFRSQLNTLMECIEKTKTRYIRCIKPNSEMTPRKLNHWETMNQLESAGLVTAITISRETFPNRLPYEVIWERFECLDQDSANRPSSGQMPEDELKNSVERLLKSLLIKPFTRADGARVPSFACGRTRVYFRTGALEHLESDRMEYYSFYAARIGNWYRCMIARVKFVKIKNMATALQARARKLIAQNSYKSMREAVLTTQSNCRMFLGRRSFVLSRKSVIKIQAMQRMVSSKRKFKAALVSVVLLQSNFRATIAMVRYSGMQTSAMKIQSHWRGSIAREATVELMKIRIEDNECAAKIQLWYRSRINAKRVARNRPGVSNSTNRNQELELSSPSADHIPCDTFNRAEPDLIAGIDSAQNGIDANELYRLKDEVTKLRNENIELRADVEKGNEDIKVISERNAAVQEDQERRTDTYIVQLNLLEQTADSLKEEKLLVEEQKQNQDAALASIRDQFAKVSQEKIGKESEIADLEGIIKSLEYTYDVANDNLKDYAARNLSLEEEVDVRDTKIEELDYLSKSMKNEIHEKDSQCVAIMDRVANLEIENGEMDVELKQSYDEINNLRGRFTDLETEAEEMNKELEKSYGEVNILESRVGLLETKGEEINSELETAHGEVNSFKTQVLALLQEIEVRDNQLKSSRSCINSLEEMNSKLRLDFEDAETRIETSSRSFEAHISTLEEINENQKNAIVIFEDAKLSGEMERQFLEERVHALEQEIQSHEEAAAVFRRNISGLEEETKEMSVSLQANSVRSVDAEKKVSSLSREVEDRDSKLQDLKDRNSSLMKTISALEGEGGDLTKQLNSLVMEKKSLYEKIELSASKVEGLNKDVETLVIQRDELGSEANKFHEELEDLHETLSKDKKTFDDRVEDLNKQVSSLLQDLSSSNTASEVLQSEVGDLMQQKKKSEMNLESSQDGINHYKEEVQALQSQLADRDERLASYTDELSILKQDIEASENETVAQKDRLGKELAQAREETNAAEAEIDLLGDLVETLKRTVETYETQSSDMTAEIANLRGNNDLLREELDAIREDRDEEVESLREQLEIALEQNSSMRREFEELEANKIDLVSHIQSLMTASKSATNRTQSLLDTNKTLLAEMSKLKIENAKIRRDLNSATVHKEDRSHPSTAKYERMVYDRETEIIELKELLADALRGRERFAQSVDKKMQQERETLLLEIHNLKAKLRNAQEKSDDYNKKIMGALQSAHSTREAGVRKLKKEVLRLTQELDKANSAGSMSLPSLVHRQRFEQTRGYLQVCQGERQRKLFELLTRLKTLQFQNGGSTRDSLLQKIINSLEELCRSEELESTNILSTFDETT